MSQENVEIVRRGTEVASSGDMADDRQAQALDALGLPKQAQ